MSILNLIEEAKSNRDVVFIQNYFEPFLKWEDVIAYINLEYNSDDINNIQDSRMLKRIDGHETKILAYRHLNLALFDTLNKMPDLHLKIKDFAEEAGFDNVSSRMLVDIVGNESKYNIHKDKVNIISWHHLGQIEWRIYKDVEGDFGIPLDEFQDLSSHEYKSYIVNPGDILIVPRGTVHQIIVKEPRASIIINDSDSKYEQYK